MPPVASPPWPTPTACRARSSRGATPSRSRPTSRRPTFEGSVDIDVDVAEATHEVVLNAIELDIDQAWVERRRRPLPDATVTLDEETERATLTLADDAAAGRRRGVAAVPGPASTTSSAASTAPPSPTTTASSG